MAESFLSTIWYRVADLRPRLRAHVSAHRHRYRGQPWYVLHDHGAGRIHRFTPGAYMVIGQFDGTRTVDAIWKTLADSYDADAPSQDDVIQLLSTLHQQDLIQYEGAPDVAELLERYNKQSRQIIKQNLTNPVSIRVPLWDPNAFLDRTLPAVGWMLGWFGFALWALVVVAGGATAFLNWGRLTENFADRILATENLLITLVTYPLLKALHELAHGYLAKRRGAEIREMGIMFLVFFPVPYVDASAAAAFRNKWHRAAVSAGGIIVETFAAAVAVMIWANAETGLVSALAFNVVMVGGLSTLVVNGNPLLKFDGYYIFSDIIEIPNLSDRATKFYGHLIQRYVFGARQIRERTATFGERVWFLLYAPSAFVYRMSVMIGIAMLVASKYFIIGVAIALWSVFNAIVKPAFKHIRHVLTSPKLRKVRGRAKAWTFGTVAAVVAAIALIPLPLRTDTEGVVWLPDDAHVRAETSGFVRAVTARQGAEVAPAAPLLELAEPTLESRIEGMEARVREMNMRVIAAEVQDRRTLDVARLELAEAQAELDRERKRRQDLELRAPRAGRFETVMPPDDLPGRFLQEGDLVGYVLPGRATRVRVVVPQDDIALVRAHVEKVELVMAGAAEDRHESRILRAVPSGLNQLPSPALGQAGGGRHVTNPGDRNGVETMEPVFVYDLALPDTLHDAPFGARVLVRFDHGDETIARQGFRRVRQLFLRRFGA
ncbi:peptidase, M50 family protein [Pseudooceanicola batsensis HTCC2597]|uniref:Peptidase, M50 family protein n=1 Tax=Pseudooceanicola batsensis (strain ATCC BAA-863 / DSM 15984 / KCTC 12145 / HTCC2597) TaxID=252305 RepID=A3TZ92_PSEBH|nr:PqqD family peptide modification chaperone [Pseudooceanicola batsensis]EAQ02910.1 peptidase, M50 family protein [Pseudooceanicola batsensis HTCC2597]